MSRSTLPAGNRGAESAHVHRFDAMGVRASITVLGGDGELARRAARRVDELEQRWSRFRSDSDITRLNVANGAWTAVSPDTVSLVTWMLAAHRETGGCFDPTLLPATVALGDTGSRTRTDAVTSLPPSAVAGGHFEDVDVDPSLAMIRLPRGMALDPGGIAKGLAADMVSEEIVRAGASGACVNIGGDLRCLGDPGSAGGWLVDVMSGAQHDVRRWTISVRDGGVATSSTLARRWSGARGVARHHLLDPATHRPLAESPDRLQLVSVVAGSAAWAEAHTKVLLVRGWQEGAALLERHGLAAAALTHDGRETKNPAWERFTQ